MKKKILFSVAGIFIFILHASAQIITGHWTGMALNQYKVTYDFQANGDTLTGKDTHFDGTVSDISNGRISKDSIWFDVPVQSELTHVKGRINGETLTLNFTVQGYDITTDLKKSEP